MKVPSRELYLDLNISIKKVMNYELQMVIFTSFLTEINLYNYDENTEGFLFGTSDDAILGSLEITPLGVVDSSKLVEELCSKETATLGVSN